MVKVYEVWGARDMAVLFFCVQKYCFSAKEDVRNVAKVLEMLHVGVKKVRFLTPEQGKTAFFTETRRLRRQVCDITRRVGTAALDVVPDKSDVYYQNYFIDFYKSVTILFNCLTPCDLGIVTLILKVSLSVTQVKQLVLVWKVPPFLWVWTCFSKAKQVVLLSSAPL